MLWVEPSAVCNLKCPGCPTASGQDRGGLMTLYDFISILDRLPRTVRMLNLWHRGEPLAAPDFPEMVAAASARLIRTHTHTNGTLLRQGDTARRLVAARLTEISIAVDGADEQTYRQFRTGGSLKDVATGIALLAKAKQEQGSRYPYIVAECLLSNQDPAQFAEVKRLALAWGANAVKFKTLRVERLEDPESLKQLPADPRLWRYEHNGGMLRMKRVREGCLRLSYTMLIAWNGDVYPCCFYLKTFAPFGNIFKQSFRNIWKHGPLVEFYKIVQNQRDQIPMCRNCTEGLPYLYVDPSKPDSPSEDYLSKLSFFGYTVNRMLSKQGK